MAVNPGSLKSHQNWAEKFGFHFPVCVDAEKKVVTAYGVVKPAGGIQRSVILVGKNGKVIWASEGMPETQEILAALDAAAV